MCFALSLTVQQTASAKDTWRNSQKLPELHHAVGLPMADADKQPKGWPTDEQGRLQCSTCHGQKNMEDRPFDEVDKKAADFLRGGPYQNLEAFCSQCHDAREYRRPNIHLMLNADGSVKKDHCTYCHEEVNEDRNRPHRPEELNLRLSAGRMCYGCHLKTPHLNALPHQAKPDEAMLKQMKASARQQGVIFPLDEDGKVTCVTCHTPHEPGVIDPAKNPAGRQVQSGNVKQGVVYLDHSWNEVVREDKRERLEALNRRSGGHHEIGYRRIQREVLLRLPAKDGTLCQSCHVFDR
ncbi:MAG: hypothetical protein PHE55_15635 [Methylococcaceae bacterium]|nr:hypothetical protein [Methylococcaceae bacterium]